MNIISSWSGGKDSCLATYKAIQNGHSIRCLLNFISAKYKRGCFHGIHADLMKLQADRIGLSLIQKEVSDDMEKYETEFKEAVSTIKRSRIGGMVFGDIYLDEHKDWVERVCKDLEIVPIEPLWNHTPLGIAEEFIDLGFKAIIVSCKSDLFGQEWIGRTFDRKVLDDLKRMNICPCGENGEFHTLVIDGPIFKRRIEILESEPILKDGFWKHWFLDIKKFR